MFTALLFTEETGMEVKEEGVVDSGAGQEDAVSIPEDGLIGFVDGRTFITVGIYLGRTGADSLDEKVRKLVVKDIEKAG